jgi:hypothetical protein
MPMAQYKNIDYGSRIQAIRTVGFALGMSNAQMPSNLASNGDNHNVGWINNIRAHQSLPLLRSLDYTGFVPALNVLVALVP